MNYDVLFLLFDLFIAGAGIYGLLEWYKMKKSGALTECKMIMPANCKVSDCRDPEGFYVYILPRLLLFGVACVAAGVLSAVNDYFKLFGALATAVTSMSFFAVIVIYALMMRGAYQRFFQ